MFGQTGGSWVVIGILFLEVVVLFFLATPEYASNARRAEDNSALAIFGEEDAQKAKAFANRYFGNHFIESGFINGTESMLVPTDEQRQRADGMGRIVPGLFTWTQQRLDGFWAMIYGVYHRLALFGITLLVGLATIMSLLIDGLICRRISIDTNEVATPVFFHGAKNAFVALLIAPLFLLLLPFTVNQFVWYTWLVLLPIVIWVTSKNVQEL